MNRRGDIDIAKGTCVLLMFIAHSKGDIGCLMNLIYMFHMPLFFVVCGLLNNNKPFNVKSKFHKILIPYAITGFIIVVIRLIFQHNLDALWGVMVVKGNPLILGYEIGRTVGPLWFLPCYFISNYVYSTLRNKWTDRELLFMFIVVFCVFLYVKPMIGVLPFTVSQSSAAIIFISLGVLSQKIEFLHNKPFLFGGIIATILCFFFGELSMASFVYKLYIIQIYCAFFLSLLLLRMCERKNCKFLEYISIHSLDIICIHAIDRNFSLSQKVISLLHLPAVFDIILYVIICFVGLFMLQTINNIRVRYNS